MARSENEAHGALLAPTEDAESKHGRALQDFEERDQDRHQPATLMDASSYRSQCLATSKRQWRQCCHHAITVAVTLALLPVLYIAFGRVLGRAKAIPAPDKSSRGSRCSEYPEDCETTASFVFDSVYSLAKQWPNTYAPNGHSIVPVTFPANIPLYHARQYEGTIRKPTWFAFDA
jgi:hypothetical protein